jgi:hypothetical protein
MTDDDPTAEQQADTVVDEHRIMLIFTRHRGTAYTVSRVVEMTGYNERSVARKLRALFHRGKLRRREMKGSSGERRLIYYLP